VTNILTIYYKVAGTRQEQTKNSSTPKHLQSHSKQQPLV